MLLLLLAKTRTNQPIVINSVVPNNQKISLDMEPPFALWATTDDTISLMYVPKGAVVSSIQIIKKVLMFFW